MSAALRRQFEERCLTQHISIKTIRNDNLVPLSIWQSADWKIFPNDNVELIWPAQKIWLFFVIGNISQ